MYLSVLSNHLACGLGSVTFAVGHHLVFTATAGTLFPTSTFLPSAFSVLRRKGQPVSTPPEDSGGTANHKTLLPPKGVCATQIWPIRDFLGLVYTDMRKRGPPSLWATKQKLNETIYNHCHHFQGGSSLTVGENEGNHRKKQS